MHMKQKLTGCSSKSTLKRPNLCHSATWNFSSCLTPLVLHKRNNFESAFTQLLEEDYYLRHHHNKTGYRAFGKLAKSIFGYFSSNCS